MPHSCNESVDSLDFFAIRTQRGDGAQFPDWLCAINNNDNDSGDVMRHGTVKWFNEAKGYGFIQPAEGGDDVFVDYRAIRGEGFRTLRNGQSVKFRAERGHLGEQATEVTVG